MGVKVVNKATGEYVELNYDSFDDFAAQYDEAVREIVEGAAPATRAATSSSRWTRSMRAPAVCPSSCGALTLTLELISRGRLGVTGRRPVDIDEARIQLERLFWSAITSVDTIGIVPAGTESMGIATALTRALAVVIPLRNYRGARDTQAGARCHAE